jgi:transposase
VGLAEPFKKQYKDMQKLPKDRKAKALQMLKAQKIRSLKDLEDYKLSVCHPLSAGIDLGSREIYVAVNPEIAAELGEPIVRTFSTFTSGLKECCEWLKYCGIKDVSMESTSVYWKNIYDMLEGCGMTPCLVNPRKFKMVPGRKTDVLDCQWLQTLHMYGLLSGSFVPQGHIRQLRSYMRYRDTLIKDRARYVQRIQKNLLEMNLMLVNVISDVTGLTGCKIITAILNGERDGKVLAQFRDGRCHKSEEEIAEALDGHYKEDQLFLLKLNFENFKYMDSQIAKLDSQIEELLQSFPMNPVEVSDTNPTSAPEADTKKRKPKQSKNDLRIKGLPEMLVKITGTDLTSITGLQTNTILQIMAEVGTDMSKFPSAKHFAAYLGFVPRNKITGGVIISSSTDKIRNPAAQAFKKVVPSLVRGKSALAAFYHRLVAKGATGKAITAVCRKLAIIYYNTLVYGKEFVEHGAEKYKKQQQERERILIAKLARKHNLIVSEAI